MSFVIFDTEYTSWKGCQENGWSGNQKKEIVQISALKVADSLEVVAEFNEMCKPVINPVLSDYFVNLTGITNEQIANKGHLFADVYNKFVEFVGNYVCYSHGWGGDYFTKSDGYIIEENTNLYSLPITDNILTYRNIAPVFQKLYKKHNIPVTSQSSGQIAEILGLKPKMQSLGLNPHNALFDVYSILEGLKYFYPESLIMMDKFENKL